jgi:hypothetical protein
VINVEGAVFGRCPQVYIIASGRGLEIGFAVAIHEDDYYNQRVKQKQRSVVPILNQKLPNSNSEFVASIDADLANDGYWTYGEKARQWQGRNFGSLANLIAFLKSPNSSVQGGGSVFRIIPPEAVMAVDFDLDATFSQAVTRFAPLMRRLVPNPAEAKRLADQEVVNQETNGLPEFDPDNLEDGRRRLLRLVAIRQGQAKFREKLFDAYDNRCAVTGTSIAVTLQAAHIMPYRGPDTNSVQNGLLLRADIHTLFDLGLLQIDPQRYRLSVAEELKATSYGKLEGRKLRLPKKKGFRPSGAALIERLKLYS